MSVSAVILTLTWPPLTRNSRVSGSRASMLYDPFHDSVSMVPTLGCGPRPVDGVSPELPTASDSQPRFSITHLGILSAVGLNVSPRLVDKYSMKEFASFDCQNHVSMAGSDEMSLPYFRAISVASRMPAPMYGIESLMSAISRSGSDRRGSSPASSTSCGTFSP